MLFVNSEFEPELVINSGNNNVTILICLAISVHAKVLHDHLVQYSRVCFDKGRGSIETLPKLFANHNALGQLTNHNTFRFFIKPRTNQVICARLGRKVL